MVLAFWWKTANAEPLLYGPVAIVSAQRSGLCRRDGHIQVITTSDNQFTPSNPFEGRQSPTCT